MARLAYHETLGVLGVGDLHPGGARASAFLLDQLAKERPRLVLEVGAGIGRTTDRMRGRGWQVVSLEPNPVLRRKFGEEHATGAREEALEAFADARGRFDAAIAESVLYDMSLPAAFERIRDLLRPQGVLALVDLVWTSKATPVAAARIHDDSRATYGLAMASRERLTWVDWQAGLTRAGFVAVVQERLEPNTRAFQRVGLGAALRHPRAFAAFLRYRLLTEPVAVPEGWLESWMAVWRRLP